MYTGFLGRVGIERPESKRKVKKREKRMRKVKKNSICPEVKKMQSRAKRSNFGLFM